MFYHCGSAFDDANIPSVCYLFLSLQMTSVIQVSVVALSSVIWVFLKSIFDDNQFGFGSWALLMSWDWAISFPWIPAIYTGIFSTGLCLWAEVSSILHCQFLIF